MATHGIFTKMDYILDCKGKFNRLKKLNVILFTFFDLILHGRFNNKYRKKANHLGNTHLYTYTHSQATFRPSKNK